MKEIITITKIDDNGNVIGTSTEVEVIESKNEKKETHLYSQYAQVFDDRSPLYAKDGQFNIALLRHQECYTNALLKKQGHIFLNEVYDMLGLPRTKAGQVVGWIYNEKNPTGDNYVEFELYPFKDSSIIIDFNVDGEILSLI